MSALRRPERPLQVQDVWNGPLDWDAYLWVDLDDPRRKTAHHEHIECYRGKIMACLYGPNGRLPAEAKPEPKRVRR